MYFPPIEVSGEIRPPQNYFTYIGDKRHVNDFSDVQVDSAIGVSAIKRFFGGIEKFLWSRCRPGYIEW